MPGEDLTDVRKRAEFDRLMNLARLNRMRGEYKQAHEQLSQAFELFPEDLDAREFAADLLYAHGKWPESAQAYKEILEDDNTRAAVEEKYAKVLLQIAEGLRQQDMIKDMLEHPQAYSLPDRSPGIAALLAGIPGLGHVYCGEAIKGGVILAITSISWLLFLLLRPEVGFYPPEQRISRFAQEMSAGAVIFLLLAITVHAYAIVNAAVTADRINSKKKGTL